MKNEINNRKVNADGSVTLTDSSLFQSLFINPKIIENSLAENSEEVSEYNKWAKIYDLPNIKTDLIKIDHNTNQKKWKMSEKYKQLNIEEYLISLCKNQEEKDRVIFELKEYNDRNLFDLLRFLVYLVDTMKENNIVWGIGRGSSVSSYVLYLMGLHRVNSLKYCLDIKEFLK